MTLSTKRWTIPPKISPPIDQALQGYPPLFRQVLANRGITDAQSAGRYLAAQTPESCDPFLLKDMALSVERIAKALTNQARIAIYGDYDVDGVTATALLVDLLKKLGADVLGYIPNRFEEGYGLNKEALTHLKEAGISLVITVDCGIRSLPEIAHATQISLDLIVTDHHSPSASLPAAYSIVNPKQPDDIYPDKSLAGVGIAYKLAEALLAYLGKIGVALPPGLAAENYLDLVALGTVADLAPLTGENRSLVRRGIEQIRSRPRQGILSLVGAAGINLSRVNAATIGYILGPRLNAAGRLESALAAFDLLTTEDIQQAGLCAQKLCSQNEERQKLTREIQAAAEQIALADNPNPLLLFASDSAFNSGVIGLAASRLVEVHYRPAIVATPGPEFTRASCRSIPEFHITEALDQCADLLEHHGGHSVAAGFTVRNENLPILLERLNNLAFEKLSPIDLQQVLVADVEVTLAELHPEIFKYLDLLQPTGRENPEPAFVTRNLQVLAARPVGREKTHLKLVVSDGWLTFDAIAFGLGYLGEEIPGYVDLLYTYEKNEYNGRETLQLNVKDLKESANL